MSRLYIVLIVFFASNVALKSQNYLPSEFSNIKFGMDMEKVLKKRSIDTTTVDRSMEFRITYVESVNKDGIEEVAYYFDNEGSKPFYEIIIVYESEDIRDKVAQEVLGEKNYNDEEWEFAGKEYKIRAWTYKTKLIITALIENTEWWEEINRN